MKNVLDNSGSLLMEDSVGRAREENVKENLKLLRSEHFLERCEGELSRRKEMKQWR